MAQATPRCASRAAICVCVSLCVCVCVPYQDPHFKTANHRRRIINTPLVTEYAYLLAPGGWLYTITDVEELGKWMVRLIYTHTHAHTHTQA